ncbi:unnamed protein product [Rotaria magnacalcarata]|uniref:Transmembrane protein n=1 Tax=Rotaria magnacalcarata TaxID=392030 RepID=A0A815PFV2_9BILA|nr:unnamed protein product [Rotaria magnacalcarata]CAF1448720.1 unnamed protein product [Rotaria magnacalcarata]CAF1922526.1 unnamed protein product [Rotaria magnacalcarata]CAF2033368.1 unnamed protein product [Rotaria magnacalcarata]CAF2086366.1 unnamed protein product [Rotaria magnacalcarata]
MCRPKQQEDSQEQIIDHYYQEQQDNGLYAIMMQQQTELEQLIQIAENLRNDIIKLHDKEKEIIEHLNLIKTSQTSLFDNIYSFISNKSVLFFVSGIVTGFYIIPTISKLFSSTRA